MAKQKEIIVKDTIIRTMSQNGFDYICITDIARQKNELEPNVVVGNWMRNRNTIEYLGLWEMLNNPNFNPIEFEGFRNQAGLNAFTLSPGRWIEATHFINEGMPQQERLQKLNQIAIQQMTVLENAKQRNVLKS